MVKQDASALRFQNKDDFKQQKVQEKCMNHHDYVPIKEIILNWGTSEGQSDIQRNQHKYGQLRRRITSYEGFRQTMLGYDYLSQNTFIKQGQQKGIGHRIGSGKESDVYIVQGTNNKEQVLKIHRLGRICFRKVRLLRDYTNNNYRSSYIKQAKIAALREYVYLKVLQRLGYSVPIVYSCNRHCVQMSYIPGRTLYHVQINQPEIIGKKLLQLAIKLLSDGIVHGDLNEFNVMITPKQDTYLIDFPQVVMSSHAQANDMFIRDVNCIVEYFGRKYGVVLEVPSFIPPTDQKTNFDKEYQRFNSSRIGSFQLSKNWLKNTTQSVLDAWSAGRSEKNNESFSDDTSDTDDTNDSNDVNDGDDKSDISQQDDDNNLSSNSIEDDDNNLSSNNIENDDNNPSSNNIENDDNNLSSNSIEDDDNNPSSNNIEDVDNTKSYTQHDQALEVALLSLSSLEEKKTNTIKTIGEIKNQVIKDIRRKRCQNTSRGTHNPNKNTTRKNQKSYI